MVMIQVENREGTGRLRKERRSDPLRAADKERVIVVVLYRAFLSCFPLILSLVSSFTLPHFSCFSFLSLLRIRIILSSYILSSTLARLPAFSQRSERTTDSPNRLLELVS